MSVAKRLTALVLTVLSCVAAFGALALSAQAAPYPNPPRITCTVTFKDNRFVVACQLRGYLPNKFVHVVMYSDPVDLGTVQVNKSGNAAISKAVSKSFANSTHTVVGTDTTVPTDVAQTTVTFGPAKASGAGVAGVSASVGSSGSGGVSASSAGSSGLSTTGVAVFGIGGTGVVLLVAGGVLLYTGRRRRTVA